MTFTMFTTFTRRSQIAATPSLLAVKVAAPHIHRRSPRSPTYTPMFTWTVAMEPASRPRLTGAGDCLGEHREHGAYRPGPLGNPPESRR